MVECKIINMKEEHWDDVSRIYEQGIKSGISTFADHVPSYEDWNKWHLDKCRFVAIIDNKVVGWIALSPLSRLYAYRGECEISIYVDNEYKRHKVGHKLMETLIENSEKEGIWGIFSVIISKNTPSMKFHKSFGFRIIGYREKAAKLRDGDWDNVYILERRSKKVGID